VINFAVKQLRKPLSETPIPASDFFSQNSPKLCQIDDFLTKHIPRHRQMQDLCRKVAYAVSMHDAQVVKHSLNSLILHTSHNGADTILVDAMQEKAGPTFSSYFSARQR
jgi:hypothetical protein